jgi:hypothetical protein
MKAIFYDRKHGCEIDAKKLCPINAVATIARTQDDYERKNRKTIQGYYELQIGKFGYKSTDCPKECNWDRCVLYSDLVFLRFE